MKHSERPVKAVIFDKDGTLQDTERVFYTAWHITAEQFGVSDIETTIRDCTGMTLPDICTYWEKKYPEIPFWPYITERNRQFARLIEKKVPLREGAVELLTALRARGYRLALATSTVREAATDHLRRAGMEDMFDALVFGDMVENGKPAPDIYLKAAAMLGVSPDECVGVEDSLNGVRSIRNAGMRAIMVPDLIQPSPEFAAGLWAKCDRLMDILPVLEEACHGNGSV